MLLGLDATHTIDPHTMQAAGYRFVCRYLSNTPGKNLIMPQAPFDHELRRYLDAGVAVVFNWESSGHINDDDTNHPGDAAAQGHEDATRAQHQAAQMGHPEAPIYFSIDFDCRDWNGLTDYFTAVRTVLGSVDRVGAYGGYFVVDHLMRHGLIRYAWQTLAWSVVNGHKYTPHPHAHLLQRVGTVQVAGVDCDVDEAHADDFGQLSHDRGHRHRQQFLLV